MGYFFWQKSRGDYMAKENTDNVREIVIPVVESADAFLVDLVIRGERNSKIIDVFIDTEQGITVDRLGEISKDIQKRLDEHSIISGTYRLNVSSPGLDRPLKLTRQYKKNIGRELEVQVREEGLPKKINGTLKDVNEDGIILSMKDDGTLELKFKEIEKAFIKLPW
jgi:ribosome maturation factor RimP